MRLTIICILGLLMSLLTGTWARAGSAGAVLEAGSYWRCRYTGGTDLVLTADGKRISVHPTMPRAKSSKIVDGEKKRTSILRAHPHSTIWAVPKPNWATAEYDDSTWARLKGPFLIGKYRRPQFGYRSVPMVCLRGRFKVTNPAAGLRLSAVYQGGIIVYVNGKEIARRHLPEGKIKPGAAAEPYALEAFVDEGNYLLDLKKPAAKNAARHAKRLREFKDLVIPASALRKGTNVLALEIHRAPAAGVMFMRKAKSMRYNIIKHTKSAWWSRVGLKTLQLTGGAAASLPTASNGRPKGFQVWTSPIFQELTPSNYGDPCDLPGRIRLCTGRGGVVSGQLVASSNAAFKGLKVKVSALKGPGTIPASAFQLRYVRPGWKRGRSRTPVFMELEEFPADPVPVLGKGGALQPVWLTVRVPADAAPGEYRGKVTVSAAGASSVDVPVTLRVVNWQVPASKDYRHSFLEFIQSPESVALHYKVEMWSEKHWKLLDRTFRLLGEVGSDMLWLTAQRKTHFGNEHAMIRFRKKGNSYQPDLSIAEKYVALAAKHMGRIEVLSLYCYRCPWGPGMHFGNHKGKDLPVLISVLGPDGKLQKVEGPKWGTPECIALWKPVFEGIKKIAAKHGISEKQVMIGATGDVPPTDIALETLKAASGGRLWIFESHVSRMTLGTKKDHPTGYITRAWGGDGKHQDPDFGRGYGWKNRLVPWRTVNREHFDDHPLPFLRVRLEAMVTNIIYHKTVGRNKDYGTHGIGRLGADFWNVLKGGRGRKAELCGRYPETAWGQLKVSYCAQHFLRPGRDGAIGTAQLEMFRESAQEIEARTFIERALEDKVLCARLGAELARRARQLLDTRTRVAQISAAFGKIRDWRSILALGVQELSEQLYATAAEVSAATNGKK
jgi:Glycoside hydrolase 123, catalytic domain/Glycoside hydrolase 123 N-terminal domain